MNKKQIIIAVLVVLVVIFGVGVLRFRISDTTVAGIGAIDPKNATYKIQGKMIALKNGIAEVEAAPGSAAKVVTRYFGNEVNHDFDGDGREDMAFLLTQETGGSGTFFYLVAALNTANGYVGSEAIFLGDRIAPQTTEMGTGDVVVVNYATRKQGESFAVRSSVGKSLYLLFNPQTMQWGEVVQNFEGEADIAHMKLDMKTWNWIHTTWSDGKKVVPHDPQKFTLTFKDGKTFSASTDCNGVGGEYKTDGRKISFERMVSTLMYCEGSQEQEFSKTLGEVVSYRFTSRGELVFELSYDGGMMVFR